MTAPPGRHDPPPCWIVVPIKAPAACKTRLAGVLPAEARIALVRRMLAGVLGAAQAAAPGAVLLLGPDLYALPPGVGRLDDPGGGLNAALDHARQAALAAGARRLAIVPADLPAIAAADVVALARIAGDAIGIAPDHHRRGTNALSIPLPAACDFAFAFGPDSFAAHRAAAARLGLEARTIDRPALARDLDLPEDLDVLTAERAWPAG